MNDDLEKLGNSAVEEIGFNPQRVDSIEKAANLHETHIAGNFNAGTTEATETAAGSHFNAHNPTTIIPPDNKE